MKVSKEALRTARQFLRLTLRNGSVDLDTARNLVNKVVELKPRHYIAILESFQRLLRLEAEKRHAIVESSHELTSDEQNAITADLQRQHGADISAEFRTTPELLGGIRVKLGSTVWDGSVRSRLDALRDRVSA